jgi:hypothetical protein
MVFRVELAFANEPDSAYIQAFATAKNNNKNGLHLAWSIDQKQWHTIGDKYTHAINAIQAKYPEITVIGTTGPSFEGSDYQEGWDFATKLSVPVVDEHYYQSPVWFIHNQDYYDKYDRSKAKVYPGEYAAHLPGRPRNLETALAEALYLTAVERNGDVVSMTSYAPLLAKEGHTQWNPNLNE